MHIDFSDTVEVLHIVGADIRDLVGDGDGGDFEVIDSVSFGLVLCSKVSKMAWLEGVGYSRVQLANALW